MEPSTSNKPGAYGTLNDPADLSVMRVNQLDAGVLDTELHSLLKTQLGRACSGLPAGTLERFKPEVDALFNLLMFRFSVWVHRPTPGMHLQGLRYSNDGGRTTVPPGADPAGSGSLSSPLASGAEGAAKRTGGGAGGALGAGGDSNRQTDVPGLGPSTAPPPLPFWGDGAPTRTQRLLHGLLSVGVQWGFARLRRHGLVHGWGGAEAGSARRVAWHVLGRLETLFRLAWMVNLLLFLKSGKYATPVDRLVRMRMVHDRADPGPRPINYQFLNRRLLWDHWAKMAYVVAPLVNWGSVRRAVSGGASHLRREARALGIFGGGSGGGRGPVATVGGGPGEGGAAAATAAAAAAVLSACAECGADPAKTPYVTECGHVFCYYCARVACTVDPRYACPRCGKNFASSRRWSQPR